MKNRITFALLMMAISSCMTFTEIGHVNMISNRNIDNSLDYKLLTTYSGGSKKELRKSRAKSLQEAIDFTVRKIPGGEFLTNAKIFLVNKKYLAVEGDVWGMISDTKDASYRGFKSGDKVTWKRYGQFHIGKISGLKDDKNCYVEDEKTKKIFEVLYDEITKVQ